MTNTEIGGIYHLERESNCAQTSDSSYRCLLGPEALLCLSGRTALQIILSEIRRRRLLSSNDHPIAYLPSYCCDAITSPFIAGGFELVFYQVQFDPDEGFTYDLNPSQPCDVFLATSYFGYHSTQMDSHIEMFSSLGVVTVEDVTHRLLSPTNYSPAADFIFGSLRKWIQAPAGGFARARQHGFDTTLREPGEAASFGAAAMTLKTQYLEGGSPRSLKQHYLEMQRSQARLMAHDYANRDIDRVSQRVLEQTDFESYRRRRLRNAQILTDGLRDPVGIVTAPLRVDVHSDCPLFVPVVVHATARPRLLEALLDRSLYMPVHWPIPSAVPDHPAIRAPYETELSLVCDHRYTPEDMERIIGTLQELL